MPTMSTTIAVMVKNNLPWVLVLITARREDLLATDRKIVFFSSVVHRRQSLYVQGESCIVVVWSVEG
ncbi:MAG: hypothetical protein ABR556_08105 [Pyrinomonadaceae bacterium]